MTHARLPIDLGSMLTGNLRGECDTSVFIEHIGTVAWIWGRGTRAWLRPNNHGDGEAYSSIMTRSASCIVSSIEESLEMPHEGMKTSLVADNLRDILERRATSESKVWSKDRYSAWSLSLTRLSASPCIR